MLHDWAVIAAAFGYIGFLFFVASRGDRPSAAPRGRVGALDNDGNLRRCESGRAPNTSTE